MKNIFATISIILFIINFGYCQISIREIQYKFEEPKRAYLCADTSSFYIIFEYNFDNDSVSVFTKDSTLFTGTLNLSSLYSKEINIGKTEEISIKINDSPILKLQTISGKNYIRINLRRKYGILEINYSKYPPIYK